MAKHYLLQHKNNPNDVILSFYRFISKDYVNLPLSKIMKEKIFFENDENIKLLLSRNYHAYFRDSPEIVKKIKINMLDKRCLEQIKVINNKLEHEKNKKIKFLVRHFNQNKLIKIENETKSKYENENENKSKYENVDEFLRRMKGMTLL